MEKPPTKITLVNKDGSVTILEINDPLKQDAVLEEFIKEESK